MKRPTRINHVAGVGAAGFALAAMIACDDLSSTVKEGPPGSSSSGASSSGGSSSAGSSSGGSSSGGADCVVDPKTHVEIINACTDAQKVDKNPDLPKLLPGGALPPLP